MPDNVIQEMWGAIPTIFYFFVGLILFGLGAWIMDKVTPFSIRKEIEEDQNIGAFRMRGQIEGRPIWVCNKCDSGLWLKLFGKPKLIIGESLQGLKDDWESGTGSDF